MKISVISNFASSLLNFRGPLLIEMVRRGHKVLAFAPDHDDATRAWLRDRGIVPVDFDLQRTGLNPLRDITSMAQLRLLFRQYRPDVVFGYNIKPVIYGTMAAWLAGVPRRYAMITGLGFVFINKARLRMRKALLQRGVSALYGFALSKANKTIFFNPDDRAEFIERGLVSPLRAVLLGGTGLDLDEWNYTPPLAQTSITFIMVGRLLRDKGVEEYVEAAKALRPHYPRARFLLVGGHDENPTAIPLAEVRSWVDAGVIEWSGHVPVRPWLAQASVFVLPSYREGVPRSTQEAMAIGLPVVTTDVPGCRETVVEGKNGFLVPVRNSARLAQAMRHFLDHPDSIVPMGLESRRLAEERFDVHVQNRKLLDFMGL
ncbi:glycosyltransferase family 4 protein (plasmid) [Sphingobium yanoikuyae]|uniref:Glycosyltransferase family 4 protein n=1 Tax=Sphingobium yanoikuyae TaxID=13690 RepID=A0A6M4GH33_SPHYA|nr:glycosyltransferase family 4 protein [Sphingobium yanoikuyae]QJR06238.1 glycosyltransferase family 4 protein [Sphingobium yanoikuyae]